jgi:hypothetical protein
MAWWSAATLMIVLGLVGASAANNLILAPTGITLTTGQVRAEAALSSGNADGNYSWLAAGLAQYELSAIRLGKPGLATENMVGIQACFLPETSLSPGIGFGVRDLACQSSEGIGPYAVVTKHLPVGASSPLIKDLAATVGIGAFGIRGPFCGFEAKLPGRFFVQGEYDSRDLNAAIGWQPVDLFRIKAYTIRSESYFGAELVPVTF